MGVTFSPQTLSCHSDSAPNYAGNDSAFIKSGAETFTKASMLVLKKYDVLNIRIADIFILGIAQLYNFTFGEAAFR